MKKYIVFIAAALSLTGCEQEEKKVEKKEENKTVEQAPAEQKDEQQPK